MNKNVLTIVLIVLLLASLGSNTYLYLNKLKSDKELQDKVAIMNAKELLQSKLNSMEDSLQLVIQTFQNENQTLVLKVEELEGDKNPRVMAALQEIYRLRREVSNSINVDYDGNSNTSNNSNPSVGDQSESNNIKNNTGSSEIAGNVSKKSTKSSRTKANGSTNDVGNLDKLRLQLELLTVKVTELMAQIEVLTNEKNEFVMTLNAEKEKSASLEAENVDFRDRLEKGARPQFGALLLIGLFDKKGIMTETLKASSIEKIRVMFDVLENAMVTQPVEEEVLIRIIDPNGGVLSTTNARLSDKSKVVSLKQTINFDGALQKAKWNFPEKGVITGKLSKGKYTAELWTRGLMRQKNNFTLN
ncbi:MAG: hypothetical protein EXR17_02765 [Flavobacteriaceae bacterium]|nr:hypothetical protein [Flavobacteriaceae bacterium]